MPKGVAVFDLDNTLGDFSSVDYFSNIYDIEALLRNPFTHPKTKITLKKQYELYPQNVKSFLKDLKEEFEIALDKEGFTKKILREDIHLIMAPLIENIDKKSLAGCMIYSNNANPYVLEFAGRAIEREFKRNDIFFAYLERGNPIRDEFDGISSGYRKKTVQTVQKATKEFRHIEVQPSDIIFFDDLIHPDFQDKGATYVHVKPYYEKITEQDTHKIFSIFEGVLYDLFRRYKDVPSHFFNLYHIKNMLKVYSVEMMEEDYMSNFQEARHNNFVSDYPIIKDKIDTFTNSIKKYVSTYGGRKRAYSLKKKRSYKKNRGNF